MALKKNAERFVEEYLGNGYNAGKAYAAVFPDAKQSTCYTNGYRYLRNPEIKEEIDRRTQERYEALNITAERIAEELATMAFAAKGDEEYTAQVKLKALDLLQKQFGLQTTKVDAKMEKTVIKVDIEDEE